MSGPFVAPSSDLFWPQQRSSGGSDSRFFLTRAIRWKPANWREAIPIQLCLGVAVISYASLTMALVGAYKPSTVRWLLNGILLLGGTFLAYLFAQSYRAGNSLTFDIVGAKSWYENSSPPNRMALVEYLSPGSRNHADWSAGA
jgi:hypothetical protein